MTEAEKKELLTCSVQDYLKHIKSKHYPNAMELFVDSVQYLTKHNIDHERTTCDINELIYVTKNEIAKYVAESQKADDLNTNLTDLHADDNNELLQLYFTDPVGFLASAIEHTPKQQATGQLANDIDYKEYIQDYNNNLTSLSQYLKSKDAKRSYEDFEKKNKTIDLLSNLESKLPEGRNSIDRALASQKPGFFEKLFNKTSEEYGNFQGAFANFNNKDHALYGDETVLKDAAMGYLRHKFPNLKEGELPTQEQINSLSGAGKPRADFCLKVVQSVKENQEIKPHVDSMLNAVKALDLKLPGALVNPEQKEFQDNLAKDLNSDSSEHDNEIEFDNNISLDKVNDLNESM